IVFNNATVTNNAILDSGVSANGAGLTVKARDDASSYNAFPASLTGLQINGGTFTGNRTGIRIGEVGKANATPTNVTISGATITGSTDAGIILTGGNTTLSNINFNGATDNATDLRISAGAQT